MDLQVVLPNESATMDPETLVELGIHAEALGYQTAWLPDHLLPPAEYGETYGGVYEPLVTLSYLAAETNTIRLGTSVLVLPMRNPFVVAKQVATLDRLSGDRITLGVGIGWDETEFDNVGADFHTRGARADESIALLRSLFRGDGRFSGKYHGFRTGVFQPLPRREIPLMVGGLSDPALRRAARLADEWQGVRLTPEEFARKVARLRELTERVIRVTTRVNWHGDESELARTLEQVHEFADAGADACAVWFGAHHGFGDRMVRFAEELR